MPRRNNGRTTGRAICDPAGRLFLAEFASCETSFTALLESELMHLPAGGDAWIQLDFAEGCLVAVHVLLQESEQSLGLLRAEVDALKVPNLYLRFVLLLNRSENQEKIPDIHSHLHTVCVRFPIIGGVG
jgi:hypothetical protein